MYSQLQNSTVGLFDLALVVPWGGRLGYRSECFLSLVNVGVYSYTLSSMYHSGFTP